MFKFLRKYNTLILVVGGSLLMVAFLLPQAIQQFGGKLFAGPVIEVDGRAIYPEEYVESQRSFQLAGSLAPSVLNVMANFGLPIEDTDHWLLLVEEADRNGLKSEAIGYEDAASAFADFVVEGQLAMFGAGQTQEQREQLRQQLLPMTTDQILQNINAVQASGRSIAAIEGALADLRGVLRLLFAYQNAVALSLPEAKVMAYRLFDEAEANTLLIPASSMAPSPESLSAADVMAHFEAFKAVRPGDDVFGVGYTLPDAVSIEWLRIDRSALRGKIEIDDVALRTYFLNNRSKYPGEFKDEQLRVENDYREQLIDREMARIDEKIRFRLQSSRQGVKRVARYLELPSDWEAKRPSIEALRADAVEASGLSDEDAADAITIGSTDGLLTREEVADHPVVGGLRFELNQLKTYNADEYFFGAKELGGDANFVLQADTFTPQLMTTRGSSGPVYYARITQVRPEAPAETLAEVESIVREDLAAIRGYEAIAAMADELREAYANGGVDAAMALITGNTDGMDQRQGVLFRREAVRLPSGQVYRELNHDSARSVVMETVGAWPPTIEVSGLTADLRTVFVGVPESRGLLLATITERTPPTAEQFRRFATTIRQQAEADAREALEDNPLSFKSLSERMKYSAAK